MCECVWVCGCVSGCECECVDVSVCGWLWWDVRCACRRKVIITVTTNCSICASFKPCLGEAENLLLDLQDKEHATHRICEMARSGLAPSRSSLLMNAIHGTLYLRICRLTVSVWLWTPPTPHSTRTAASSTRRERSTSMVKST